MPITALAHKSEKCTPKMYIMYALGKTYIAKLSFRIKRFVYIYIT